MADPHASREPVRFDLGQGSVRAGGDERVVLVPCSAFDELGKTAGVEVACGFGRAMGAMMGKRLGASGGLRAGSLEDFVNRLATELAVSGWGSLTLERWGRAMVLVVEHSPLAEHRFLAAILEGAVAEVAGRDVRCVPFAGEGSARILVASQATAERVKKWIGEGLSSADILGRLHAANGGKS